MPCPTQRGGLIILRGGGHGVIAVPRWVGLVNGGLLVAPHDVVHDRLAGFFRLLPIELKHNHPQRR